MNDFLVLFRGTNMFKIIPQLNTSRAEQLNALTRLSLWFAVIILLFEKNSNLLCIPIGVITMCVLIYHLERSNRQPKVVTKVNVVEIKSPIVKHTTTHQPTHQTTHQPTPTKNVNSAYILAKHLNKREKNSYNTNPMMNIPDPPAAFNADDEDVNDNTAPQFKHDLFRDLDELWERKNNERQFYTAQPQNVPNNQVEFAKWLYGGIPTCKEDQSQCFRQTELRRNNGQFNPY